LIQDVSEIGTIRGRTIAVDADTMATGKEGVYAAGDMATGTTSVIQAIAAGRLAASSIDKYLGGDGDISEILVDPAVGSLYRGQIENFADKQRVAVPTSPVEEREGSFNVVEYGYSPVEGVEEADRCLQCHLRCELLPSPLPPEKKPESAPETITLNY